MVAIGQSLMSNPRILLCDELSLGLAPIVIRDIYAALAEVKTRGTSVVLVSRTSLTQCRSPTAPIVSWKGA